MPSLVLGTPCFIYSLQLPCQGSSIIPTLQTRLDIWRGQTQADSNLGLSNFIAHALCCISPPGPTHNGNTAVTSCSVKMPQKPVPDPPGEGALSLGYCWSHCLLEKTTGQDKD